MIHDIDIVQRLLGEEPERVDGDRRAGAHRARSTSRTRGSHFPGGCVANLTASRVSPTPMRKFRFFQPDGYFSIDFLAQSVVIARRVRDAETGEHAHRRPDASRSTAATRCSRSSARSAARCATRAGAGRRGEEALRRAPHRAARGGRDAAARAPDETLTADDARCVDPSSAGDASGELHAAALSRASCAARLPGVRFLGLGGAEMEKAGVEIVVHAARGRDRRARRGAARRRQGRARRGGAWRARSRRSARSSSSWSTRRTSTSRSRAARGAPACPVLYYVSPQVWAWRRGRIRKLARRVDRMAVIFPFEPRGVRGHAACRVEFVGHPLVDRIAPRRAAPTARARARALGARRGGAVVALLPGSRRNELRHLAAAPARAPRALLHARDPRIRFALALAPSLERARRSTRGSPRCPSARAAAARASSRARPTTSCARPTSRSRSPARRRSRSRCSARRWSSRQRVNPLTAWVARRVVRVPVAHDAEPDRGRADRARVPPGGRAARARSPTRSASSSRARARRAAAPARRGARARSAAAARRARAEIAREMIAGATGAVHGARSAAGEARWARSVIASPRCPRPPDCRSGSPRSRRSPAGGRAWASVSAPVPRRHRAASGCTAASVGEVRAARGCSTRSRRAARRVAASTTTIAGRALCAASGPAVPSALAPLDHPWCVDARASRRVPAALLVLVETELWPIWIRGAARARRRRARSCRAASRTGASRATGARARSLRSDAAAPRRDRRAQRARRGALRRARRAGRARRGDRRSEARSARDAARARARARGGARRRAALRRGQHAPRRGGGGARRARGGARGGAAGRARARAAPRRALRRRRGGGRGARPPAACAARSGAARPLAAGDVLVLDTIGELAAVYGAAAVAFVGGTLAERGGHNLLEPAQAGRAPLFGPHIENTRDAAELLLAAGGARAGRRRGRRSRAAVVGALRDPAAEAERGARARAALAPHRGATERSVALLERVLAARRSRRSSARERARSVWRGARARRPRAASRSRRSRRCARCSTGSARAPHRGVLPRGARAPRAGSPCRVVSVGSLVVGGTGKTPLAAWLAARCARAGGRSSLASRGYGRAGARGRGGLRRRPIRAAPTRAGDEPLLLAAHAPGVPVVVGRDRGAAGLRRGRAASAPRCSCSTTASSTTASRATSTSSCSTARRASATAPCCRAARCASRPPRSPAPTRSSSSTGRCPASDEARVAALAPRAARFARAARAASACARSAGAPRAEPPATLRGRELGLLAGIARPAGFRRTLESLGARVVAERDVPRPPPLRRGATSRGSRARRRAGSRPRRTP